MVSGVLTDWRKRCGYSPLMPRATTLHSVPSLAGEISVKFTLPQT